MKKWSFILLLITTVVSGQRQTGKPENIDRNIRKVSTLLADYAKLSPFSEDENRFDRINSVHDEIISNLLKILNDKRVANYSIESVFKSDELVVSKSEDNLLYFISLDQKSGGSFVENTTLIHFRLPDSVHAMLFEAETQESQQLGSFSYGEVYLLDVTTQKYLAIGGTKTCNTCHADAALIVSFDGKQYQTEQLAFFDGRFGDLLGFNYDRESKTFNFERNAAANDDSLYGGDNEIEGYQHRYRSTFKYVDGQFVPIEKCEFWDKIDSE